MRLSLQRILLILFSLFLSISLISAQTNCPALVQDALDAVANNCSSLARNEACYGYNQVSASFLEEVAPDFFSEPASLAPVETIATLQTAPLNVADETWGIALMNLQANIPNSLPGQNVTFVLLGDVQLENAVAPETAFQGSAGVEVAVTTAAGANLRSGPGTNFNVVGGVQNGDTVLVDGFSEDGQWLRTVYRERPVWISLSVVDDNNPALRDLPTLSPDLHSPMQAFYLRTGIGQPECGEALDDVLLVQGPKNIEVELTVNGANIQLGSTGILRMVEDGEQQFLEITVLDGTFKVDGQSIRAGQRSRICMGDEESRGLDGEANDLQATCAASAPETVAGFGEALCKYETVPANLLHYPVEVLCPGEALPTAVPVVNNQGASDSELANVSCDSFSIVSPLAPVNSGTHTFSWTAVEGANIRYDLVFYNQGREVNVFSTTATEYTLNLGAETQTGGSFQWEVRAFSNDQYACVTARSAELVRTGELDGIGGGVSVTPTGFWATLSCTTGAFGYVASVSFGNATSGGNVALQGTRASTPATSTDIGTGPSGTLAIADTAGLTAISIVDVNTSQTINLPNCP